MAATLERLEDNRVVLDVTVPVAEVETALSGAYRRLVGRVAVPGFRRGKVPRGVFERFVGRARLWQEALDPLVQQAYGRAVEEAGVEPVTSPDVEITEAEDGQPLRFKATVTVKPEVVLAGYRDIALLREAVSVDDADVERTLEELRASRAVWAPAEDDPAVPGMLVVIDVTGEVDGEPANPEEGVGAVLGEHQLRPELEQAVTGLRAGDARDVSLTFPAEDSDKKLAGRTGTFHVVLRECKRKQLPELDDEFAREVAEVATLEELRPWLKNRLRQAAEARAEAAFGDRAAAAAVDQATVEVPAVMVDRQVDADVRDLAAEASRLGVGLEAQLAEQGKTLDELRAEFRPRAERQVRTALVLEAIAETEGLTVSDDEFRQHVERVAASYGQQAEAVRRTLGLAENRAELRNRLRLEKAVSFLKGRASGNAGSPPDAAADGAGAGDSPAAADSPAAGDPPAAAARAAAPRRGRRRGQEPAEPE